MTPQERAEQLRQQAQALEDLAGLEAANLAAKQAYAKAQTPENHAAKLEAAEALNAARAAYRTGPAVSGDAFIDNGSEG